MDDPTLQTPEDNAGEGQEQFAEASAAERKPVRLLRFFVRRDAATITTVTVPEHELTILRAIHGKDQVYPDPKDPVAGSCLIDPEGEYGRMSGKYGPNQVAAVYGDDGGFKLAELAQQSIDRFAAPEKKKAGSSKK
jgi:hypothetical protein